MKKHYLLGIIFFLSLFFVVNAQSISAERVEYQLLKEPKIIIEKDLRQYSVAVTSPYNLTTEDVVSQSKIDFQNELNNYDKVLEKSKIDFQDKLNNYNKVVDDRKKDFQQRLNDYDTDVIKAKEKFQLESDEFKKLTLLERLSLTDQRKNPRLVVPNKPTYVSPGNPPLYVIPTKPEYHDPNLNNYVIIDNNVLASKINIDGFSKDGNYLTIILDVKKTNFQDNSGQTYANQPTTLIVKENGKEKINKIFFQDYEFISSSPTNKINKVYEEKRNVNKVITYINSYLNETFGFQTVISSVSFQIVKNKGQYDDLEKADIYVSTNLKKLNPLNPQINVAAMAGMQKGIDIWKETLTKVDYKKDSKSDFNPKIAKFVFFNLINLNLALGNKTDAEKFLNEMQENLIYMKLNSEEENELKELESKIYKTT